MAIDPYRTPLLTARETARYLKMPESTLNVWLASPADEPLVHAVRPERRGWPRVPFVGIVEAHVLRALRESGMSMNDIRNAATIVRTEFNDRYALATRRIATDGVAVFVRLADRSLVAPATTSTPSKKSSRTTYATSTGTRAEPPSDSGYPTTQPAPR